MTGNGDNGSNRWFFSRIIALGVGGVLAKAAPYLVIGGALFIAGEGIYRWRRIKRRRRERLAAYDCSRAPDPPRIFEEEEGDG